MKTLLTPEQQTAYEAYQIEKARDVDEMWLEQQLKATESQQKMMQQFMPT